MSTQYCLEVKRLEDLRWKSRFHSQYPDLYVKAKLGADVEKTRIIKKSRAPAWDEPLVFSPSDASEIFTISVLHDSNWLRDPCVGTVDIKISDLLAACTDGEACLDLLPPSSRESAERPGTIVIHLECIDSHAAATIMIDKATDEVQHSGIIHSPQTSETLDADNNRITQLSNGSDLYGAVYDLVSKLDPLIRVVDIISTMHPYLTIAWNLSSGLLKAVKHVIDTDKKVVRLVTTMGDAYAFTCDVVSLPDKAARLEQSITGLVKQTIECCLFVEKYARRAFAVKTLSRSSSDKIDEFEQSLTKSKGAIESGVNLKTALVSVRISDRIDEILLCQRLGVGPSDASSRRTCLTGTRVEVLKKISDWIFSETDQNMFWLHGVAGSGKSTVSMTIAERLRELSRLGGLVTFERGKSDPLSVIRTIAYKLALYDSRIASQIIEDTNKDKDIVTATVDTQFQKLLLQPLTAIADSLPGPVGFVIDALDECGASESRWILFRLFKNEFVKLPKNFRFLITSRREPDIDEVLSSRPEAVCTEELDNHSIASQEDVLAYLRIEIRKIMTEKVDVEPADWNWEESVAQLGNAAGGLFIFASTAVKMISNSNYPFEDLQDLVLTTSSVSSFGLDDLYATALENSGIVWTDNRSRCRFAMVLGLVILGKVPLSGRTIDAMIGFLPHQGSLQILKHLRSLLTYTPGGPISLLHTSFFDYLLSPARVNDPWYIDVSAQQHFIATRSFAVMGDMLHFNMCKLGTSFVCNEDVSGLAGRVEESIPAHLTYACLYWSRHLCSSPFSSELMDELSAFVHERLLFWFEVLSLVGVFRRVASRALLEAAAWIESHNAELSKFMKEASRLASEFAVPIVQSTPHIYTSMIPLTKDESLVSLHYSKRMLNLVHVEQYGERRPPAWLKVLEGHSEYVWLVSVSPDGSSIASASWDMTVKVWDMASGEELLTLAHNKAVFSVCFSPDGSRLVSCCADNAVRIWDAREGNLILAPLEQHTRRVLSVTYSTDGKRIASGCDDHTVIIWDALSGAVIAGPFSGHSDVVWTVAFSCDGTRVASGSADKTLRIWDVETGALVVQPLAHHGKVNSVAFCPTAERIASCTVNGKVRIWDLENGDFVDVLFDGYCAAYSPCGTRIAIGSFDGTIYILDANSGDVIYGPLEGHSHAVWSVGFSPDGKYVVSGSWDRTIRIWDAVPGQVDHKETAGHTSVVTSVAFSPCGRRIASASADRTIIIWDARTGEAVMDRLFGHTDCVNSLVFSMDGSLLVSGSNDKTIRLWDVESGKPIAEPLEGHTEDVNCVVLSPDGMQIVSGSDDATMRVWDMVGHKLIAGPLQHHSGPLRSIAFSPDGKWLASGSQDKTIAILDTKSWKLISEPITSHEDWVISVHFSPDSTRVASGSDDCAIIVWDVATGQIIAGPFRGQSGRVRSVVFLPDGLHLASGAYDGTITLWNVESGQAVGDSLHGHSSVVASLALSSDGVRMASGSWDKTIKVWDVSAVLQLAQNLLSTATPTSSSSEQNLSNWIMEKDGWILGGPDHRHIVCWIPPDLRRTLLLPQNAAICCDFWTKLDFANAALGHRWTKCFATQL